MPGVGPAYFMILGEVPKKKTALQKYTAFPTNHGNQAGWWIIFNKKIQNSD
jgi:hypothetical protein